MAVEETLGKGSFLEEVQVGAFFFFSLAGGYGTGTGFFCVRISCFPVFFPHAFFFFL
jgi:hypothetical protein